RGGAGGARGVARGPRGLARLEGVLGSPGGCAAPVEPLLEPAPRLVAVLQRAERDVERIGAPELTPEGAGGLTIEGTPDGEPAPHDGIRGNEPPRNPVEVDLDAPPRPLPQAGDH